MDFDGKILRRLRSNRCRRGSPSPAVPHCGTAMMKLWHCLINGQFRRGDKKKKKGRKAQTAETYFVDCGFRTVFSF